MKLRVERRYNEFNSIFQGYGVQRYDWLLNWVWYDTIAFESYDDAQAHAENIKKLRS